MDVAIRDAMLPDLDGGQFFRCLRELGVSAIEIEVKVNGQTPHLLRKDGSYFTINGDHAQAQLQARLKDEGVRASALLLATDFSGDEADAHVGSCVRACYAASRLGAPVVRIDPLARDRSLSGDRVRESFVRNVVRVLRQTEDTGIDLGIENHGPVANDPEFLDEVFAAVEDPRLGLTLDTGNFYWFGHPLADVYRIIERYAPRAKHTHVKNINYPPDLAQRRRPVGLEYGRYCCPLDEGNIDLRRVAATLRAAGYDRDLCVEDESLGKTPPEGRMDVLRRDVRAVREALGAAGG
jgi:sugar phosphate isomerase/epimerase